MDKPVSAWGRQKIRLMRTSLSASALALLMSLPAFGQSPPSPDLAYIGSVELRPERSELSAGWTIQILDPTLETIELALAASFGTALVTGADVVAVQSEQVSDQEDLLRIYHIELAAARDMDRPRHIKIAYGGPFRSLSLNALDSEHIELTGDSRWFPVAPAFDHRLSAQVSFRAPGDWTLVGAGETERIGQGYRLRQEHPNFDVAIGLLSAAETFEFDGYRVFDVRSEPGTNWSLLKEALTGCRAFLNDLAAPAGPLPEASILLTNRSEGAYSRGTFLSLMDIEDETPEALYKLVCHELTHHWSAVSPGGPDDWINEGVAEYVALMAVREHFGQAVFDDYLQEYAQSLEEEEGGPVWTPEITGRTPPIISYRAAPLVLAELEARMGTTNFRAFLQTVLMKRPEDTSEMIAELEQSAGPDLRRWFEKRLKA